MCSRWYTPDSTQSPLTFKLHPAVAVRLLSRRRRNPCEVSVDMRRQLASSRRLFHIACQPLRGLKSCKSVGPVLPNRLMIWLHCYGENMDLPPSIQPPPRTVWPPSGSFSILLLIKQHFFLFCIEVTETLQNICLAHKSLELFENATTY
jgi:hypothetical protein